MGRKPRGQCIFCGSFNLTKEHLVSAWVNRILPGSDQSHKIYSRFSTKGGAKIPRYRVRQGRLFSRQRRIVCGNCNEGWMRGIEEKARPILTQLMTGEQTTIDLMEQYAISTWVTLKSIVSEFDEIETMVVSHSQRELFWSSRSPISNWGIWIGNHNETTWRTKIVQITAYVQSPKTDRSKTVNSRLIRNVKMFTFGLGRLFVHAVCTKHLIDPLIPEYITAYDGRVGRKLLRVWPAGSTAAFWPAHAALSEKEMHFVAYPNRHSPSRSLGDGS